VIGRSKEAYRKKKRKTKKEKKTARRGIRVRHLSMGIKKISASSRPLTLEQLEECLEKKT